jgi:hypothetical protein
VEAFTVAVFAILYAIPAAVAYGLNFAYFQRKYWAISDEDYYFDMAISVFIGITWPIGIIAFLIMAGTVKYGLKFR